MPIYYRTADGKPPMGGRPPNFPWTVPVAPFAPAKEEKKKDGEKKEDKDKSAKETTLSALDVHVALSGGFPKIYPPGPWHHVILGHPIAEKEKKPEKKDRKKEKKGGAVPPVSAWILPKPADPKASGSKEKADKQKKDKSKDKDKAKEKKDSPPAGTLLLPATITIHLLKRKYKPWLPENSGQPFPFKVARVPPSITMKEFLDELFEGMKMKDAEKNVVECLEVGKGAWARGSTWTPGADQAKRRLFEVGWMAHRGAESKPVWLAWGTSGP